MIFLKENQLKLLQFRWHKDAIENFPEEDSAVSKRHSITVDESQYVRDNSQQTTQIHFNGFYEPGNYFKLIHSIESPTTAMTGVNRNEWSLAKLKYTLLPNRDDLVKSATTVTTTASNSSVVASSVAMPVTLFGDDNKMKTNTEKRDLKEENISLFKSQCFYSSNTTVRIRVID
ncbi:hypothetical protein FF38_06793 [Lucilia cuprina]|uniref:Uncharacterized protein n=1 Tax=Lucilia cuprina TaxID=7375 RepID=A0A0L0CRE0_LUCCU|nr:hypothetical protein FF38_06793 [Lucilia cuprina]